MSRRIIAVAAVVAAIALAAYLGFRDGQEHRNAPATENRSG